jgi:hypothetical protein
MHEGEAGGALKALGVILPGFGGDAIVPVIFWMTWMPMRAGVITRGTSEVSSSPSA